MKLNSSIEKLIEKHKMNKLSPSNLIVTNDVNKCVSELKYVVKTILCSDTFSYACQKCNICHLIDENSLSNFIILEPDGANIKKDQVNNLLKKFILKPEIVTKNIYIIKEADKLNLSSSNAMLKFIEEPLEDNIGFLVINNVNSILPTIVSRCQITNVIYQNTNEQNQEIIDLASEFIYNIENNFYETIFFIKESILSKEYNKDDYILLLNEMLNIYKSILFNKLTNTSILDDYSYLKKLTISQIKRKIKVVTTSLNKINYNVNINLFLENMIIEMR